MVHWLTATPHPHRCVAGSASHSDRNSPTELYLGSPPSTLSTIVVPLRPQPQMYSTETGANSGGATALIVSPHSLITVSSEHGLASM